VNPFQKAVFAAAIQSLEHEDNPLRFNNFATNLRELGRIILADLALDKSIKECAWYVPVLDNKKKEIITRAQRVKYAVQAGLPDDFVRKTLRVDVERTTSKYTELIEHLSSFTHINGTTFAITQSAERKLAEDALKTFSLVLKTIDDCRSRIMSKVEDLAQDVLTENMLERTVDALEEIATHYEIDEVNINRLKLYYMGPDQIAFKASGTVDCTLQYGSDSDVANDTGMRVSDHYPLTCEFVADISTPLELEVRRLQVDNSSFYE